MNAPEAADDKTPLKIPAYILAGLAMMLNIRLSYSSAPYALIRFRLPENLFSVFVRRMASALELWCLPSMLLGNAMDLIRKAIHGFDTPGKAKKDWIYNYQSIFWSWANFLTFVILLFVYRGGGDQGHLTLFYLIIAISGFVFGINMVMVYAVEPGALLVWYMIGENSFPAVTSLMHYFTTLIFGNRRKYNSDYLIVYIDIWVAILISFAAAVLWTVTYCNDYKDPTEFGANPNKNLISPVAMVIVGMGLVYAIYPGIAPGMIVPFYLIDRIDMILLIATAVPPVIIGILRKTAQPWDASQSPVCAWYNAGSDKGDGSFWHAFDLLIVLKISLAAIFIYCLHYRDSSIARSIINQPKMSTVLSITFYMCHEILLAVGFPGIFGMNSGGDQVMLPAQYVGALFMIFLAFYSEGYIIEYKSHDPAHWPTEGMTKWNAFCYWCKRASKITHHNLISLCSLFIMLYTILNI